MVAYSFQPQFVDPILSGRKQQTIRRARLNRSRHARPGDAIQLYIGMRTRACRLIGRAVCEQTASIEINPRDRFVRVDGVRVLDAKLDEFAQQDGFSNWEEMSRFWMERQSAAPFSGTLIRWRDFRSAL